MQEDKKNLDKPRAPSILPQLLCRFLAGHAEIFNESAFTCFLSAPLVPCFFIIYIMNRINHFHGLLSEE